jgi:magnesium-transporting ATPase (P-type)
MSDPLDMAPPARKPGSIAGKGVVLGAQIDTTSDAELAEAIEHAMVLARFAPAHKERIIRALQSKKHVVGFLGDGINDALALRTADVGISKVPFLQSRASLPLTVTTGLIMAIGILLPFSPLSHVLGLAHPPLLYWPLLLATLFCYAALTQVVKGWILRRGWI